MSVVGMFALQPESRRITPSALSRPSTSNLPRPMPLSVHPNALERPLSSPSAALNAMNGLNTNANANANAHTSTMRKWSVGTAASMAPQTQKRAAGVEKAARAANADSVVGSVVGVAAERKEHARFPTAEASHQDHRRERLQRIYRGEKGKDSIFAKLKLKFIMPFMEPALQDSISKAIDELVTLPTITMSDIEKLQKRIQNIEKEFRCRNPTAYESRPSTSQSQVSQRYSASAPPTPSYLHPTNYDMGNTVQAALQWTRNLDDSGSQSHIVALEKSRLSESKRQFKEDLLKMSLDKQQRLRELLQQEQEEADRLIVAHDLFLIEDENQELRSTNRKLANNESRIDEIVNKIYTQNIARSQDLREEQERMKELQGELAREQDQQNEVARKRQDGLRMTLVETQSRNKERKDSMMRSLEQDQETMRQYLDNYDYQMMCRDEYERRQKETRLARAHAVKHPYSKSIPEKSHEDEIKAEQERIIFEEKMKEEELKKVERLLRERDELHQSVQGLIRAKEERWRKDMEENARQAEYWRIEAELEEQQEEQRRIQRQTMNREYARQLLEQSRSDRITKYGDAGRSTLSTQGYGARLSRSSSAGPYIRTPLSQSRS